MKLTLPTDSKERKDVPLLSGFMNYFPAAMAWIARISLIGDRKHNPENEGPPFHSRGKSMDHGDCIVRHTMDIEDLKAAIHRDDPVVPRTHPAVPKLIEEAAYRAWRSCAELQELCEKYGLAPVAPAARFGPITPAMRFDPGPSSATVEPLSGDFELRAGGVASLTNPLPTPSEKHGLAPVAPAAKLPEEPPAKAAIVQTVCLELWGGEADIYQCTLPKGHAGCHVDQRWRSPVTGA